MPRPLDLSQAKVMVAPARLNLRRNASYNNAERLNGPLSSTSSRFNFNHLLFSPPPSPSLPALVPRPKKSPTKVLISRPSRVFRYLFIFTSLATIFYLAGLAFRNRESLISVWPHFAREDFEMVGQDAIPDFPTPIVVSQSHSKAKWTMSIPHGHDFPLTADEYAGMGSKCREASSHTRELRGKPPLSDEDDEFFVDVYEAEQHGLLPPVGHGNLAKKTGHFVGLNWESMAGLPVCTSSLTFVLESPDAGLGTAVLSMWMLYGLAKEQGRAFFIDDSRWAYGIYTDIFQAPPLPHCRPPPRHRMLPCPAQAKHLVVSSTTLKDVFPALMAKHRRGRGKGNLQDLMALARTGYEALFKLNKEDGEYATNRINELKALAKVGGPGSISAPIIGIHIRHGDLHPLEYQYRHTYIPSEIFVKKSQDLVESYYRTTGSIVVPHKVVNLLGSDDPTVYQHSDFSGAIPAQERIQLSSKEDTQKEVLDPHMLHHFEDEQFGWEGGFFAQMFWNMGSQRKHNGPSPTKKIYANDKSAPDAPSEQILKLRSFMGRAYMLDLAVLAGASDRIVCGVSATGCRMLGVMMGWEAGIQKGGWVNVDGEYEWAWMNW